MSAFTLYLALHRAGLQIATDGEQLIVVPAAKLTEELRAAIRQHKSGLIELLQSAHHTAGCFLNWVVDLDPNTSAATAIKFRTASLELDRDVQDFIDKAGGSKNDRAQEKAHWPVEARRIWQSFRACSRLR